MRNNKAPKEVMEIIEKLTSEEKMQLLDLIELSYSGNGKAINNLKNLGFKIKNYGDVWRIQQAAFKTLTPSQRKNDFNKLKRRLTPPTPLEYDKAINPIAEARLSAGLTQKQAAELCGVPLRTWQEWEQGRRTPPQYVLQSIIEKLKEGN